MTNLIDTVGDNQIILEDGRTLTYGELRNILRELGDPNLLRTLGKGPVTLISNALNASAEAIELAFLP